MPESSSHAAKHRKILEGVRSAVRRRAYRFTIHAAGRMTERHISVAEVEQALLWHQAEVIEDYPDDPRSPSCLVLCVTGDGRVLHVQCSYPPGFAVITVYEPDPAEWINGRIRKGGKP